MNTELRADYDHHPINQLCTADGPSKFVYHRFRLAKPLDPIRNLFDFMVRLCSNDLFHRVWYTAARKASQRKHVLAITDIVDEIWRPAFKECESTILHGLKEGSIKLHTIDHHFRHYNSIEDVESHLHQLNKGVEMCYGRNPPPKCPPWIHNAVSRIEKYWTLDQYASAARTILELKEKLKLTGDFHEMSAIAEQVQ